MDQWMIEGRGVRCQCVVGGEEVDGSSCLCCTSDLSDLLLSSFSRCSSFAQTETQKLSTFSLPTILRPETVVLRVPLIGFLRERVCN